MLGTSNRRHVLLYIWFLADSTFISAFIFLFCLPIILYDCSSRLLCSMEVLTIPRIASILELDKI